MRNINKKNYDFLWRVGGVDYLFTSIWYNEEYQKRDFLIVSFNEDFNFFVSKKEREKLSNKAVSFFTKDFDKYENRNINKLKQTREYFKEIKNKKLGKLSNQELAKDYLGLVKYIRSLWREYFWTEYFHLDKITEILEKNDNRYSLKKIKENLEKMAKLKYKQREFLNMTFYETYILNKYHKEINKRLKLDKNIYFYNYLDLIQVLRGGKVKLKKKKYFVLGKITGNEEIIGQEAKEIGKRLLKIDRNIKEFKGQIGNKGYYRGRVRKISFSSKTNYYKKFKEMKKGEVLVSGSTGPEMMIACKKAGAIITDEGGITSHAVLVSREFGIPSIIGTKIATRILRDGDKIEVDADKGIVRILNKYKK